MTISELTNKIYRTLTLRRFRQGALPDEDTERLVKSMIEEKIAENNAICMLLFWGGAKNPNLPISKADLAEKATLDQFHKLNEIVKEHYQSGLNITIITGGARVEYVNGTSPEKTEIYQQSFAQMIADSGYSFITDVVPIGKLYKRFAGEFFPKIEEVRARIEDKIPEQTGFDRLVTHAERNICSDGLSDEEIIKRGFQAAKDYIIYRVAEEEAKIFREYSDCIRGFLIKYAQTYSQYIVGEITPPLEAHLVFYSTSKGDRVQPWQATGIMEGGKVICLTQERLKNSQHLTHSMTIAA